MLTLGNTWPTEMAACYTWHDWKAAAAARLFLLPCPALSCPFLLPCCVLCAAPSWPAIGLSLSLLLSACLPEWPSSCVERCWAWLYQLLCVCVCVCVSLRVCTPLARRSWSFACLWNWFIGLVACPPACSSNRSKPKRHYFPFICCLASPHTPFSCFVLLWHYDIYRCLHLSFH